LRIKEQETRLTLQEHDDDEEGTLPSKPFTFKKRVRKVIIELN
jgi:hypothetical protein